MGGAKRRGAPRRQDELSEPKSEGGGGGVAQGDAVALGAGPSRSPRSRGWRARARPRAARRPPARAPRSRRGGRRSRTPPPAGTKSACARSSTWISTRAVMPGRSRGSDSLTWTVTPKNLAPRRSFSSWASVPTSVTLPVELQVRVGLRRARPRSGSSRPCGCPSRAPCVSTTIFEMSGRISSGWLAQTWSPTCGLRCSEPKKTSR